MKSKILKELGIGSPLEVFNALFNLNKVTVKGVTKLT